MRTQGVHADVYKGRDGFWVVEIRHFYVGWTDTSTQWFKRWPDAIRYATRAVNR